MSEDTYIDLIDQIKARYSQDFNYTDDLAVALEEFSDTLDVEKLRGELFEVFY